MTDRPFPEYYKWVHPDPRIAPVLVQMEHFATARFWEGKAQAWGPIDMDDLAEQIDNGESSYGVWFEQISAAEADELKLVINARFENR